MEFTIRTMEEGDLAGVVALQAACFPPPFPEDHLWDAPTLAAHLSVFPEGQWVALREGKVIGSCSNARIPESRWATHMTWIAAVTDPEMSGHDPHGEVLFGADISVHPEARRLGVGRALYRARFEYAAANGILYGTGCRLPGLRASGLDLEDYVARVCAGEMQDRTLTPLLRMGLQVARTCPDYMEDEESRNAAAILERTP